jgi:hypothetical protein
MIKRFGWMFVLLLTLTATRAYADPVVWGPQAGISISPTQFVFGLHAVTPIGRRVDFVPSVDFGVGDEAFTIAGNGDIHINVAPDNSLRPYVGGGITIYNINPNADGVDGTTEVGGMLLGGIWLNRGGGTSYYLEARLGLGDVPDFKALIGLNL